ncbi:hypothetical protein CBD41_04565 [bacterium TMED181]|nr:hypothetical protein [Planctomycetota bacterium]OUW45080.1 MAG: hypothetical protein CBD41_04565 [bacterium TMED181]
MPGRRIYGSCRARTDPDLPKSFWTLQVVKTCAEKIRGQNLSPSILDKTAHPNRGPLLPGTQSISHKSSVTHLSRNPVFWCSRDLGEEAMLRLSPTSETAPGTRFAFTGNDDSKKHGIPVNEDRLFCWK